MDFCHGAGRDTVDELLARDCRGLFLAHPIYEYWPLYPTGDAFALRCLNVVTSCLDDVMVVVYLHDNSNI